jgi:predicted nucleic acid-binding protein
MIVVSDTTPIHYLILIGSESVLPALFESIIVPDAVRLEMLHPNAPEKVRGWIGDPPAWIRFAQPEPATAASIIGLGKGETSAIAIAIDENADAVLMDDKKAIREARNGGLTVLTTFAVLEIASRKGLLDLEQTRHELSETSFRMPPDEVVEEYCSGITCWRVDSFSGTFDPVRSLMNT